MYPGEGTFVLIRPAQTFYERITFELSVEHGALAQGASSLEVKKNDTVTITVSADEPISFHLHGYDIEEEAAPDAPASLAFTADATGSFPFTTHLLGGSHEGEEGHDDDDKSHDEEEGQHEGDGDPAEEGDHDEEVELGRLQVQPR